MKWEEVRQAYPHQWLKLKVLKKHIKDNKEYVDDMEVIKKIDTDLEAGRELGKCKDDEVVYHTYHEEIYFEIKNIFGFRMVK